MSNNAVTKNGQIFDSSVISFKREHLFHDEHVRDMVDNIINGTRFQKFDTLQKLAFCLCKRADYIESLVHVVHNLLSTSTALQVSFDTMPTDLQKRLDSYNKMYLFDKNSLNRRQPSFVGFCIAAFYNKLLRDTYFLICRLHGVQHAEVIISILNNNMGTRGRFASSTITTIISLLHGTISTSADRGLTLSTMVFNPKLHNVLEDIRYKDITLQRRYIENVMKSECKRYDNPTTTPVISKGQLSHYQVPTENMTSVLQASKPLVDAAVMKLL